MRGEQRVLGRQVERRILGDASPAATRELVECVGGHRGHWRRLARERRQEGRPVRRHVAGGAAKARGERLGGGVPQLLLQPKVRQRHHLHVEEIAKRQLAVRRLAHRRPHLVELRLQLRLEHFEWRAAVAWDVVAHDKEQRGARRRGGGVRRRGAQLEVDFEHEAEQVEVRRLRAANIILPQVDAEHVAQRQREQRRLPVEAPAGVARLAAVGALHVEQHDARLRRCALHADARRRPRAAHRGIHLIKACAE